MRAVLALSSFLVGTVKARQAGQVSGGWNLSELKSLVTFGDSYVDETRFGYFATHNGPPPAGWVDPGTTGGSSGGLVFGRYASKYSGATLYNYGVGGASCSNAINARYSETIRAPYPSMLEYAVPAYVADRAMQPKSAEAAAIDVPVNSTVHAFWIGTNDVAGLAWSQEKGKTLVDYMDCVFESIDKVYASGARNFVLMNVVPLNIAPHHVLKPDNPAVTNKMLEATTMVNEAYKTRTQTYTREGKRYPGAHFAVYDINRLFMDIYNNPRSYLNGTAPPDVKAYTNECDKNFKNCKQKPSPDSYMWWDELHPSEQVHRLVAKELVAVMKGTGRYATYFS